MKPEELKTALLEALPKLKTEAAVKIGPEWYLVQDQATGLPTIHGHDWWLKRLPDDTWEFEAGIHQSDYGITGMGHLEYCAAVLEAHEKAQR